MKHVIIALLTLVFALSFSPAFASLSQTQVSQLYIGVFGRASEGSGNSYWQTDPQSTSMTATANVMLNTEPAKAYFGATLNNNQDFIEHIYLNTLGKTYAEDTAGVDYWVSELDGGKSKGEVIAALIVAAQHPDNAGVAQDRFNNKVEVSNYCADNMFEYTDLSTFVGFVNGVTDDYSTVSSAKVLINAKSPVTFAGKWEGAMFPGHYIMFKVEDINGEPYITSAGGSYVAIGCLNDQYNWESTSLQSKIVNNESHIYFPDDLNFGDGRGNELHIYFDSYTELHGTWLGETFCTPLIDGTLKAYHCIDKDNDGYDSCNECNDNNAAVNPDADEICDGVDNDCDGVIDEGLFYPDEDGDGYGNADALSQSCPVPENYVKDNTDCDDANMAVNPGKKEISQNFLDDNCDGQIDEGSDTISTFPIDSPGVILLSPNGAYLYVTNYSEKSVRIIRTSDSTVIDTVFVDGNPYSLSVTQDGNYVYVVNVKYYRSTKSNTMSVIRTSDNTVTDTVSLGYYVGSGGMAVLPDGDYVYFADSDHDSVSVLRTSDNTITGTIPVGDFPVNPIASPNGAYIYVPNSSIPSISVIRTSDNSVIKTIPSDNSVIKTFPIGSRPRSMAFTQAGDYLYVTENGPDTVLVIRTSDNTITDTISVGLNPKGIAVSPDGKYLYVANMGEVTYCPGCPAGPKEQWSGSSLSVILTSNNTVLRNIPMNGPVNIALMPSGKSAYVTVFGNNLVTEIGFPD